MGCTAAAGADICSFLVGGGAPVEEAVEKAGAGTTGGTTGGSSCVGVPCKRVFGDALGGSVCGV